MLVDSSVLIKWFWEHGESEVQPARALRDAHVAGRIEVSVLDLAVYEVGNVLIRPLGVPADTASQLLDQLLAIVGEPRRMQREWLGAAMGLAEQHRLTFYDAAWAAAAAQLGVPLVSADDKLLGPGLAISATAAAATLEEDDEDG